MLRSINRISFIFVGVSTKYHKKGFSFRHRGTPKSLNHPFYIMDLLIINHPAIGVAPWLWKPPYMVSLLTGIWDIMISMQSFFSQWRHWRMWIFHAGLFVQMANKNLEMFTWVNCYTTQRKINVWFLVCLVDMNTTNYVWLKPSWNSQQSIFWWRCLSDASKLYNWRHRYD